MTDDNDQTNERPSTFAFSDYSENTLFHERRLGRDRRAKNKEEVPSGENKRGDVSSRPERRERKERRKRIDPTTFEKQYTEDELEFMNAMQRFKERTGKQFPTHGEVIKVAMALGYRKVVVDENPPYFLDGSISSPLTGLRPSGENGG